MYINYISEESSRNITLTALVVSFGILAILMVLACYYSQRDLRAPTTGSVKEIKRLKRVVASPPRVCKIEMNDLNYSPSAPTLQNEYTHLSKKNNKNNGKSVPCASMENNEGPQASDNAKNTTNNQKNNKQQNNKQQNNNQQNNKKAQNKNNNQPLKNSTAVQEQKASVVEVNKEIKDDKVENKVESDNKVETENKTEDTKPDDDRKDDKAENNSAETDEQKPESDAIKEEEVKDNVPNGGEQGTTEDANKEADKPEEEGYMKYYKKENTEWKSAGNNKKGKGKNKGNQGKRK